ncbi:hypothetical protein HYH03_006848 [Edaphochlamys debaryana]|uniref:Protein kinase domain-containing protein n=1 Tax=Edaphochlamys debaryana TaxID=47281 RepID=A0A835Y2W1_9CHLO|nr:hypothetical protein HYH03_006848 [Edaphochlamys debaryana]|eukprot:KAG2494913.1 hypothetical protein HYH03_006848 [Edaphochlamys debaryana]
MTLWELATGAPPPHGLAAANNHHTGGAEFLDELAVTLGLQPPTAPGHGPDRTEPQRPQSQALSLGDRGTGRGGEGLLGGRRGCGAGAAASRPGLFGFTYAAKPAPAAETPGCVALRRALGGSRADPDLVQLLEACLRPDPRDRLSAEQLMHLPYFSSHPYGAQHASRGSRAKAAQQPLQQQPAPSVTQRGTGQISASRAGAVQAPPLPRVVSVQEAAVTHLVCRGPAPDPDGAIRTGGAAAAHWQAAPCGLRPSWQCLPAPPKPPPPPLARGRAVGHQYWEQCSVVCKRLPSYHSTDDEDEEDRRAEATELHDDRSEGGGGRNRVGDRARSAQTSSGGAGKDARSPLPLAQSQVHRAACEWEDEAALRVCDGRMADGGFVGDGGSSGGVLWDSPVITAAAPTPLNPLKSGPPPKARSPRFGSVARGEASVQAAGSAARGQTGTCPRHVPGPVAAGQQASDAGPVGVDERPGRLPAGSAGGIVPAELATTRLLYGFGIRHAAAALAVAAAAAAGSSLPDLAKAPAPIHIPTTTRSINGAEKLAEAACTVLYGSLPAQQAPHNGSEQHALAPRVEGRPAVRAAMTVGDALRHATVPAATTRPAAGGGGGKAAAAAPVVPTAAPGRQLQAAVQGSDPLPAASRNGSSRLPAARVLSDELAGLAWLEAASASQASAGQTPGGGADVSMYGNSWFGSNYGPYGGVLGSLGPVLEGVLTALPPPAAAATAGPGSPLAAHRSSEGPTSGLARLRLIAQSHAAAALADAGAATEAAVTGTAAAAASRGSCGAGDGGRPAGPAGGGSGRYGQCGSLLSVSEQSPLGTAGATTWTAGLPGAQPKAAEPPSYGSGERVRGSGGRRQIGGWLARVMGALACFGESGTGESDGADRLGGAGRRGL